MRMKEGLYEVPGSRSPHIRMKDYDVIRIDLDGNMGKIRSLSSDHYFISYLSSSNQNYRSFPVEPRRDPRGRNIGVINYYRESGQEDVCIHLVAVDTERFLISGPRLPTSHSEAKPREFSFHQSVIYVLFETLWKIEYAHVYINGIQAKFKHTPFECFQVGFYFITLN